MAIDEHGNMEDQRKYPYRMKVGPIPKEYNYYPFKPGEYVVILGEISNMQGHYVIACQNGQIAAGYHDDWFVEVEDD